MAQPKGWHPERIVAELRMRFGNITDLSVSWGYHRSMVSRVIRDPQASARGERRIADAIGVTPHTLWPDRWTPEGAPLPRSPQTAPGPASRHRQNERAA